MGMPDPLTCILRNLWEGHEATVRTGHWTTDWFQIGKGVRQGCILSPWLFNIYAEYIMSHELVDVQAGFRKGRGIRDQIANILWIMEKAREFQKNIYFCFIDYAKAFVWTTTNCRKFWKRWEYQTTWPASWEICMQVRKQQLELDMEQQTGSK